MRMSYYSVVPLLLILGAASVACSEPCSTCYHNGRRLLIVSWFDLDECTYLHLEDALEQQCNDTTVKINYTDNSLVLGAPIFLSNLVNLEIVSASDAQQNITCSEGAGLYMEDVSNVKISGISWTNCSVSHPTTVHNPSANLIFPNVSSALFFFHSRDVNISSCNFTSAYGSGVTMYDVGGEVHILDSEFTRNDLHYKCENETSCFNRSTGIYIEKTYCGNFSNCSNPIPQSDFTSNSTYVIDNCRFELNNNEFAHRLVLSREIVSHRENRVISHGGGIGIRLTGNAHCNNFYISNCNFSNNTALWGGGMEVGVGDSSEGNTVQVSDSYFEYNQGLTGGALRFAVFPPLNYDGFGANTSNNLFNVTDCVFFKNNAEAAGALSYISSRQTILDPSATLLVINSLFESNYADNSGTAVSLSGWNNEVGGFPTLAKFVDCTFDHNFIQSRFISDQSHTVGFGTLSTHEIPLYFSGNNSFTDNIGTALVISSTAAIMSGDVSFTKNTGVNGGAVHIMAKGWIDLDDNVYLHFYGNLATLHGGAVYSSYVIPTPFVDQRYCIFVAKPEPRNVTVFFDENRARISGHAIFLGSPGGCFAKNASSLPFSDDTIFCFDDGIEKVLATSPGKIEFAAPASNDSGIYTLSLSLGQLFNFTPIVKDFFNKETVGVAALSLKYEVDEANKYDAIDYSLSGQTLLQLNNTEMTAPFTVIGKEMSDEKNSTVISFFTSSFPTVVGYLHLNITPCQLGHVYNRSTQQCECFNNENLYCDPATNRTCVKYGYWLGKLDETSDDTYTTKTCTFELCKYTDGQCPIENKKCNAALGNYCELNLTDKDSLCAYNRAGVLCSDCRDGYDFTYSALLCVSTENCGSGSIVLSVFLNIIFWVSVVIVIALSLRLDMRLGSGYLYCLIYYFGVVLHLTTNNFPSAFLKILVYLFTGILQINPRIFGLIPTCSFFGLNAIQHHFLFYIHPIFLGLMTLSVITIGRCFPRYVPSISRESYGLRSLCIFLYLSFNALSETSLNILDFLTFPGNGSVFVSLSPKYEYMDLKYHLPYAVTALCVELFIIVPLLFFLLFSPLLARVSWINLTRLKPLLDEYQSCYKDNCRWFAGFYLVCRQLIFLFSLINFENSGGILFLQILCIIVLIVHAVFQPYRKQWLNVMDTILLADLAIYSLMNGSTVNVAFGGENKFRSFLVHVLILIPVLFLFSLIAVSAILVCTRWRKNKVIMRLGKNLNLEETLRSQKDVEESTYVGSNSHRYVPMEREPLIMSGGSRRSGSTYSTVSPPHSQQSSKEPSSRATTPVSDIQSDDGGGGGGGGEGGKVEEGERQPWYRSLQRRLPWSSSKSPAVTRCPKKRASPELKTMAEVVESLDAVDVRRKSRYTTSEAGPGTPSLEDASSYDCNADT